MSRKPDLAALFGAVETSTFPGLDTCSDIEGMEASSAFIGVPCATPYISVGPYARNGPDSIRKAVASLTANTDRHNFDIGGSLFPKGSMHAVDCGDLPWHETDFASNRETIRKVPETQDDGISPDKAKIAAVDFVEIFPEADIDGQGGITVSRLVAATMGIIARQQMAR